MPQELRTLAVLEKDLGLVPSIHMGAHDSVDRNFCPAHLHSYSVTKKHTEAYINCKLLCLLAQAYY